MYKSEVNSREQKLLTFARSSAGGSRERKSVISNIQKTKVSVKPFASSQTHSPTHTLSPFLSLSLSLSRHRHHGNTPALPRGFTAVCARARACSLNNSIIRATRGSFIVPMLNGFIETVGLFCVVLCVIKLIVRLHHITCFQTGPGKSLEECKNYM